MALIIDTNLLIHAERQDLAIIDAVQSVDQDLAIAAITIAELRYGVEMSRDDVKRQRKARFLRKVRADCDVIGYDDHVADEHGKLLAWCHRSGVPHGAHDLIIAATARAEGRTLITGETEPTFDLPGVTVQRLTKD